MYTYGHSLVVHILIGHNCPSHKSNHHLAVLVQLNRDMYRQRRELLVTQLVTLTIVKYNKNSLYCILQVNIFIKMLKDVRMIEKVQEQIALYV